MLPAVTDVLIYADSIRSPEMRHEVPIGIPDPFLYAEKDGVKHIAIGAMEIEPGCHSGKGFRARSQP